MRGLSDQRSYRTSRSVEVSSHYKQKVSCIRLFPYTSVHGRKQVNMEFDEDEWIIDSLKRSRD